MLETLIAVIISLNLNYSIISQNEVALSSRDCTTLLNSKEYIQKSSEGLVQISEIKRDEGSLNDIIIVPDIDPVNSDNK